MVLAAFLLMVPQPASAAIFRYDGPYEGKVVDADTGEPIQGAVVLGVWNRIHPNVAGWNTEFYDAVETVTDKNGDFYIKGLGILLLSNIDKMNVLIFKAGYDHLGYGPWKSFRVDYLLKQKIAWKEDKAIIPIKKLTKEQSKEFGAPSRPNIPEFKMRLLTNEINIWRKEQGFEIF